MKLRDRPAAQKQPLPSRARNANERQDISEGFVMDDDHFGGGTLQYREQMTLRIRSEISLQQIPHKFSPMHHDGMKIKRGGAIFWKEYAPAGTKVPAVFSEFVEIRC